MTPVRPNPASPQGITPVWIVGLASGSHGIAIFPERIGSYPASYPYGSLESGVWHEVVHLALSAQPLCKVAALSLNRDSAGAVRARYRGSVSQPRTPDENVQALGIARVAASMKSGSLRGSTSPPSPVRQSPCPHDLPCLAASDYRASQAECRALPVLTQTGTCPSIPRPLVRGAPLSGVHLLS